MATMTLQSLVYHLQGKIKEDHLLANVPVDFIIWSDAGKLISVGIEAAEHVKSVSKILKQFER